MTREEEEVFIMEALKGHVYALSIDQQGTHVIRKVLECSSFDVARKHFIFDEIFENLHQLSTNKNGLCVIKLVIKQTTDRKEQQRVISQLEKNLIEIVSDAFGNYAVSEIVEHWDTPVCQPIFKKLMTKVCELSIQKYSSCVIEKCIKSAGERTRSLFIREISRSPRLSALVSHQFGNYVIQTALIKASAADKDTLIRALENCLDLVQDKKIRQKWYEIIEEARACYMSFGELQRRKELESLRQGPSEPSVDYGFEECEESYDDADYNQEE